MIHGDTALIKLNGQCLNSRDAAIDNLPGFSGLFVGLDGCLCSILCTDRHFLRRRRHLVDRRRHLVCFLTLLVHGTINLSTLIGHTTNGSVQLLAHGNNLADKAVNLFDKRIERTGQLSQFVSTHQRQPPRQITLARRDFIEVSSN